MEVKIAFVKTQRSFRSVHLLILDVLRGVRAQKSSSMKGEGVLGVATRNGIGYVRRSVGVSPSGKAPVFGIGIPRFESWHPSHSFFLHMLLA